MLKPACKRAFFHRRLGPRHCTSTLTMGCIPSKQAKEVRPRAGGGGGLFALLQNTVVGRLTLGSDARQPRAPLASQNTQGSPRAVAQRCYEYLTIASLGANQQPGDGACVGRQRAAGYRRRRRCRRRR